MEVMKRVIENEIQLEILINFLKNKKLPITVDVQDGRKRSVAQNRLQRQWMLEAAEQLPQHDAEEWRAICKLTIGVPILYNEDDNFREKYQQVVKPLPYETKIELMKVPFDFPVTRLMTTKQKKKYLDDVYKKFTELGVHLTDPESLKYA